MLIPRHASRVRVIPSGTLLLLLAGCMGGSANLRPEAPTTAHVPNLSTAAGLEGRSRRIADMGDFWIQRATYPTGEFNAGWLRAAAREAQAMPVGRPLGTALRRKDGRGLNPSVFTALGPMPLGTGNGVAGRVNAIVSHPTQPNIAWLGADGGGIWKTTNCCDNDTTWTIKTDHPQIQNSAIGVMTMDPTNPDVLYAGTGDLRFGSFSFGANGVLKSTDGGETWVVKGEDVFNPFYPPSAGSPSAQYQAIGQVEVDPNNSNIVIVGTKTGLFFSYDAGDHWTGPCITNAFSSQRQDITGLVLRDLGTTTQVIAAVGTRGFATTVQPTLNQNGANGIYRGSVPASGCPADWSLVSRANNGWPAGTGEGLPTPANTLGRIDLAIAPSDNGVIYAQVGDLNAGGPAILGVWRSDNGGDTWTQWQAGTIAGSGTQSWYNAGMLVHPTEPMTAFLSAFRTFRSTNGGDTFSNVSSTPHVDHHALAFVGNDPNRLLIGTDGGIYISDNALAATPTWLSLNRTLNTIELYSGALTANFASAASSGAVGGAQDNACMVSTWTDGNFSAQPWSIRADGSDGIWTTIEPVLGQRWYYSRQSGVILASTSAQGTGTVSASPSGWGGDRKSFLTQFDLYRFGGESTGCPAATGCGRIVAGSFRVWESTSGGVPTSSWVANSPDLTKGTLGDRSFINQVHYAINTPDVAIAGTNDGNVWMGFGMGRAADVSPMPATWVNLTDNNTVLPNRYIMDVATDPLDPLIGYASVGGFDQNTPTTPGHIFQVKCTASCSNFVWRNVSGNLPNIPANSVIVNPNRPTQLFAGTDWGLYYTDNVEADPVVWQKHAGLPSVMIWDLNFDRGFTTLAAWTRARGAWVWPLPTGEAPLFANGFE